MMVFMLETKNNRTTAAGIYQQIAFIWKKHQAKDTMQWRNI